MSSDSREPGKTPSGSGNEHGDASAGSSSHGTSSSRDRNPVDFGSFVNERVRHASGSRDTPGENEETTTYVPASGESPQPRRRPRDSRYWRNSLEQSTGEQIRPADQARQRLARRGERPPESDDGGGGDNGGRRVFGGFTGSDGGDNGRRFMLYVILAIVLLGLIMWGAIQLFGDDNGGTPGATPTMTTEPTSRSRPTQAPAQSTQPPATVTPDIESGGDNQLNNPGAPGGTPTSTPSASKEDIDACSQFCLVRVTGPDASKRINQTGNRPSFSRAQVAWAIVTPAQYGVLKSSNTELLRKGGDTLSLYMVEATSGDLDVGLVGQQGDVIDVYTQYALVAWADVPAIVAPVTDAGFNVYKFEPKAPAAWAQPGARGSINAIDPGQLMDDVDPDRMQRDLDAFIRSGAVGDDDAGTRYYIYQGNQEAADFLFTRLEETGIDVWYEDFITPDGYLLNNVVAEIPGKQEDHRIGLMAHFDSTSLDGNANAVGADDNGSGIVLSLEVVRILARYQLDAPVRVVFTNAEEVGLLGSDAWARQMNANKVPIDGVINVDSIGYGDDGPIVYLNSDERSGWLSAQLAQTNDQYGLGQNLDILQNPGIVADDNFVREQNIDAVMVARTLYGQRPIHHSSRDVPSGVDLDSVTTCAYLVLVTIGRLASA